MDTKQKLDKLADLMAERDYIALKKQELLEQAMPAEVKQAIADINAEFAPQEQAVSEAIDNATKDVKDDVLKVGESVKGDFLHAVFVGGRISWDTKGIDGFAVAHPEINAFKKQGEPSVTIRKI